LVHKVGKEVAFLKSDLIVCAELSCVLNLNMGIYGIA